MATTKPAPADNARYLAVAFALYAAMTNREKYLADSFFGGPAASRKAKDYLRALLAASTDAALVADLRFYFNDRREGGDLITQADVSAAIRLLAG